MHSRAMTTTCRSDIALAVAAVVLSVTAANQGACQQVLDKGSLRAENGASVAATRDHVVREGETLWQLAGAFLGDPARWPEIVRLNPQLGAGPHRVVAGTVLRFPASARPRVTMRVASGEAPIPSPSSDELDVRFQGRTVFFRARGDSLPPS
jgi:hypothetical protein